MHDTINCKPHTFLWQYLNYEITKVIYCWSKYYSLMMGVPFDAPVGTASLMYGIPTHNGIIESDEEKVGNTINLIKAYVNNGSLTTKILTVNNEFA